MTPIEQPTGNSETATANPAQPILFFGKAGEYFGIWISNLLLSIITLGVYSAWAKVRRVTYFRNRTIIVGDGFGYHATGRQIFQGRVIVLIVIVCIGVITQVQPMLWAVVSPVILFLSPVLINASMRFDARMTSYRNVRFNWHGTYWKTFFLFVIGPFVGIISLFTLTPLLTKLSYCYFAEKHSYGSTYFSANPRTASFYFAFLISVVTLTILGAVYLILDISEGTDFYSSMVFFSSGIFLATSIYFVRCRNVLMRNLTLGTAISFASRMQPGRYIWIVITNLLIATLSVGLMLPWCQIRMYHYLATSASIKIDGGIDSFVDSERSAMSAFGEEFAEFEGMDVTI